MSRPTPRGRLKANAVVLVRLSQLPVHLEGFITTDPAMNAKYPMLLQGVTRLFCLTSITVTVAKADSPSFYSKVVPGQAPEYWMETAVHEDQSSSRLLV